MKLAHRHLNRIALGLLTLVSSGIVGHLALASRADVSPAAAASGVDGDWGNYGRSPGGDRFSPIDQITPQNVASLRVEWTYRTRSTGPLEGTPLKVGSSVYLCTGQNVVSALDAETGTERWRFDPKVNLRGILAQFCRGVAYFRSPNQSGSGSECAERIVTNTVDARLIAVDARTGKKCSGFGIDGEVDLRAGMGDVPPGYYLLTSAPTVVRGKIVLGGLVADGQYVAEPPGVIRAFDAVSGKFAWAFDIGHPDKHSEPAPGEQYARGTPNAWAPMSADETLGLVFAPTGNATPDYFGGHRSALDNKYSSSVVALDAESGEVRWSFQTAHYDIWDYDVASQPTLLDIPTETGIQPALLQPTKRGELFLLDRRNGHPLAEVREQSVSQEGIVPEERERVSKTQPFSVGLPSLAGPPLTEADMWGITPFDQLWCRIKFRQARYEGPMTPPGLTASITYPGYNGGMDWGSVSVDLDRMVVVSNTTRLANYNRLITRAEVDARGMKRMTPENHGSPGRAVPQEGVQYGADIQPFLSPLEVPCQRPPYGMLSAVDLKTRKLLWSKPLGTARDAGPLGLRSMLPFTLGTPNAGGSVVTRGGVLFISAATDQYLRAFNTLNGKELWKTRLPAGGQATPMSYYSDESGRQFIVIAAGGHFGMRTTPGDYIIAFALPKAAP